MEITRVMICDDDAMSAAVLEEILSEMVEEEIYKLTLKGDIIPFMKKLKKKKKPLDFIFLNARIKKENTLNIIKKMSRIDRNAKIILCGGRDLTDELLLESLKYDVNHILGKPYDNDEIASLLKKFKEEM